MNSLTTDAKRTYTLALLTGIYFVYLLDRNAVLVTQELIKEEFSLSDTQVGLVTGLLYGMAYALAGLPLSKYIGRVERTNLLSGLVATWSLATFLCGFATRFWHLAAARLVVGAAESGGSPTSLSILSDIYPPERRAAVSSIFFAGAGLGGIASFLAGGFIATEWGWRAVFLIYGLPGLILAGLVYATTRDTSYPRETATEDPGLWTSVRALMTDPALMPVYIGSVLCTFASSGVGAWMIPYLMRVHQLPVTTAGVVMALALGVLGTLGGIIFGFACDWREGKKSGGLLQLLVFASGINAAAIIGFVAFPGFPLPMACLAIWGLTALVYSGASNAAVARLAPERSRAIGFALFAVLCNLIGAGLGPLVTGMISDAYQTSLLAGSLKPAFALLAVVQLAAGVAYWRAQLAWRRKFALQTE